MPLVSSTRASDSADFIVVVSDANLSPNYAHVSLGGSKELAR